MRWLIVAVALASGCGNGSPHTAQAQLALGGSSVGITKFKFDTARVGTTTRATFTLANTGDAPTGVIAAQVTGDPDFTIDPQSPCAGAVLDPQATCDLTVVFAPTTVATHTGTLEAVASPGGTVMLGLGGDGGALGITFDPPMLDFGSVEVGQYTSTVHVTNTNPVDIAITSISINGPYLTSTNCGASLAAGGTCDVAVTFAANALGTHAATLTVDSAGQLASEPVTGLVGGRITVARMGGGSGTVTSDVGGIDCGATCTTVVANAVTLTATPAAGSLFLGWSEAACGSNPQCTLPADALSRTVDATFADSSASALNIQFAGNASGEVLVDWHTMTTDTTVRCTGSCTVPVSAGDNIVLTAATPSDLVGWTGPCASSSLPAVCSFTVTGNTTATITFSKPSSELWTRVFSPGALARSGAFDSMNRLVVGTTAGVVGMDQDGATRWVVTTVRDPTDPSGTTTIAADGRVRVDASDNTILLVHRTLAKLDSGGNLLWSVDLGADADPDTYKMGKPFDVAPGGDVAVQVGQVLKVYSTSGVLEWSSGTLDGVVGAVAIDSAGKISTLAIDSSGEAVFAYRFAPDGTTLPSSGRLGNQARASLAFDGTDSYVTSSWGNGNVWVERFLSDGLTNAFIDMTPVPVPYTYENGVAVSDTGQILCVRHDGHNSLDNDGFVARQLSPTGTVSWTLTRPYIDTSLVTNSEQYGADVRDIAVDHQGHVAIIGGYYSFGLQASALVQLFAP